MKHLLPTLLLALSPNLSCLAQDLNDLLEKQSPKVILLTGVQIQWFGETYKLYNLSIEHPISKYWHLGLQGTFYLKNNPEYYYYSGELLGGFEMVGHAKHFLHGRFSGRKSGLYLGPEIRFGKRNFQRVEDNFFFPPPPVPNFQSYSERVTKILVRWGVQWQFGHATLELAAPFGVEFYSPTTEVLGLGYSNESQFVLLPSLQFGLAF